MKYVLLSLIMLLVLIIQTVLFPSINLFAAFPDLLLALVVSVAILEGTHIGLGMGFFVGLLTDILYMSTTGWGVVFYMLIAFIAGQMRKQLRIEQLLAPALICMGGILLREIITLFVILAKGLPMAFPMSLLVRTLPMMLYTGIAAIAGHYLMNRLYRLPFMRRR